MRILHLAVLLVATSLVQVAPAHADKSFTACGYVFVNHDDGSWTVYKDNETVATYGTGYSLDDLKKQFCS